VKPTFFTDRDLGRQFPEVLRKHGVSVECHADHLDQACSDVEWLTLVGSKGWYAITHDRRIRYKPNELAAVLQCGIGLFVVVGKARHLDLAENFVRTLPRVHRFIQNHERPFIAHVTLPSPKALSRHANAPGEVTLKYPRNDAAMS
jgi:hypothetical protein